MLVSSGNIAMLLKRLLVVGILVSATVLIGYGQSSPVNRPWPPGLQQVDTTKSPPLSAEEALKTFYMPPGYRLELVAAEPLVQDPTVIDWDPQGRLWVVEMTGFVRNLEAHEPNLDPIGRIVVLEDTDRDGKMDKRTVFADDLAIPRAVKALDRGVLVAEPGILYWMQDTDGDLRADKREIVTKGYGRREGSVEGNANSLFWGLDNWIHTAGADVMVRYKDGQFDVRKTLSRGEWGVTQDDAGRIYRNTNESALHVDLVPTPYYSRNPLLLRTRGSYESFGVANEDVNVVWPVRPNPGTNRAYQLGIDRPDGTLAKFTAVCAPMIYRGDSLPAELYGNAFVAEPAANLVGRIVLTDDGTSLRARKAYDKGEFLASTDERFRPVFVANAPDGFLYIADMYRGIIQDRSSTTLYLRDHIVNRGLDRPTGLGRIYRVVHESSGARVRPLVPTATPADNVRALSNRNGWWRDTAQRLLVERGAASAGPAVVRNLTALAQKAPDWRTRLHALWVLDGVDRIEPPLVMRALQDSSRDVRMSAVRLAERWLGEANHPIQAAVLKLMDDADWSVREQLAASIGALPDGPRETAVVAMLDRHSSDPVVMDAALSGVRGREVVLLDRLLAGAGAETPQRVAAITMVAALIARGGQDTPVQGVLSQVADEKRPAWQRTALLRGAEVALLNSALPGTPPRRGGPPATPAVAPPCSTCPGARAGPGGAYAFPGVREAQQAAAAGGAAPAPTATAAATPAAATGPAAGTAAGAGAGRGGGGPILRLNREPAGFSSLASATGELSPRATAVLARIEWPGKPGARAPLPPLTAAEEARFDAGREVYRNVCQACHQPDGRGQDRVAPPLVGSALAIGPAEVTARILLNGKEGPVGLMPPLGATFTDEQIASVLTYVRREWGQTGTPVTPETVRDARAATAGRTRPWTDEELAKP